MVWANVQNANNTDPSGGAGTIAVTLPGVAAGNLVIVGLEHISSSTISSFSDSGGNTWTKDATITNSGGVVICDIYRSVITTGGSLIITSVASVNPAYQSISASEYSHSAGIVSKLTSSAGAIASSSGSWSCGAMTFSGPALVIGAVAWSQSVSGNTAAMGGGFNVRTNIPCAATTSPSGGLGLIVGDLLNSSTSPVTPAGTFGGSTSLGNSAGTGAVYQATGDVDTFAISPTSVTASSTGNAITVTGTGTAWTAGTPGSPTFTASTGTITGQVVASTTSGTLTYNAPASGPVTIKDPSTGLTATLTITGGQSMAAAPSTSTNGQTVTYTLTGTGTSWLTGTTFSISGVTGASITSQSCNAGTQVGTVTILLDNTHTGTLTFTDSVDSASATSGVTLGTPGAPQAPSCTAGNNQNVLNWSAPNTGGLVATYSVFRGTSPGGESGTALATGITLLTYTDSTAVNGTTYYYTVKAVNTTGTSVASSEVSGTPGVVTGVINIGLPNNLGFALWSENRSTSDICQQYRLAASTQFYDGDALILTDGIASQVTTQTALPTHIFMNVVTDAKMNRPPAQNQTTAAGQRGLMTPVSSGVAGGLSALNFTTPLRGAYSAPTFNGTACNTNASATSVVFTGAGSTNDFATGTVYIPSLQQIRTITADTVSGGVHTFTVTPAFSRAPTTGDTLIAVPFSPGSVGVKLAPTNPFQGISTAVADKTGGHVNIVDVYLGAVWEGAQIGQTLSLIQGGTPFAVVNFS
jgi:hypothetical protein